MSRISQGCWRTPVIPVLWRFQSFIQDLFLGKGQGERQGRGMKLVLFSLLMEYAILRKQSPRSAKEYPHPSLASHWMNRSFLPFQMYWAGWQFDKYSTDVEGVLWTTEKTAACQLHFVTKKLKSTGRFWSSKLSQSSNGSLAIDLSCHSLGRSLDSDSALPEINADSDPSWPDRQGVEGFETRKVMKYLGKTFASWE